MIEYIRKYYMRLRYILTIILLGSLLSGAASLIILFFMNPLHSVFLPILFLACITLFISGLITVFLLSVRALKKNSWHIRTNISTSIRQGLIIGITISTLLIMSHFNVLTTPTLLLAIALSAGFEYLSLPKEFREAN